ncbi:MAG: hypothetical protein KY466_09730 [Gemmatimonadetes bacterium]|nr:hypothetical protein [Gemmatimonadota bacterium]
MYSTCLFCHSKLGRNEAIEHLPVGRRLAFDPLRGRLWVVCGRCARWNLTPFDERWEALEECEKAFRGTQRRFSTENIGLARLREGVELVRIGKPHRPEFAGWRYGDEFVRRNRRMLPFMLLGGSLSAAVILMPTGVATLGFTVPLLVGGYNTALAYYAKGRPITSIPDGEGGTRVVRAKHVWRSKLQGDGHGGWVLRLPLRQGTVSVARPAADRLLLPMAARLNMAGARRGRVRDALVELDMIGYGDRYMEHVATVHRSSKLGQLPRYARLALEMAAHEAEESRAIQGDLSTLEAAWREAEEIAAIADRLPEVPDVTNGPDIADA